MDGMSDHGRCGARGARSRAHDAFLGQSSEDLVSKRSDRAAISGLDSFINPDEFRANLVDLQKRLVEGSDEADAVSRFLKAWEYWDEQGDW
jgi:hypothetical protein